MLANTKSLLITTNGDHTYFQPARVRKLLHIVPRRSTEPANDFRCMPLSSVPLSVSVWSGAICLWEPW